MRDAFASRKHTLLLVVVLVGEVLQPTATAGIRGVAFDFFVVLLLLVTFLVVFESSAERKLGLLFGAPAVAANWMHYLLTGRALVVSELLHHGFMCFFFIFATVTILRGIFRRREVNSDAVVGAVCGYLLSAASFGNIYAVVLLLSPGAFAFNSAISGQLLDWHARRFLFDYFSLVTLTSMGYGYVTPVTSAAQSVTWMESVFGQFYLAVVVAQLVGMRLAPKAKEASSPTAEKQA